MDKIIKSELASLLNRVTRSDADESVYDYYILDPRELITLKQKLADAEKWRKVRKIFFDCSPCTGCPGCDIGSSKSCTGCTECDIGSSKSCKMVMRVNRFIGSNGVEALKGEGEKG